MRRALADLGSPRLLLVAPGADPPIDLDDLEDWAWSDARAREVEARLASLDARASRVEQVAPVVDDDDVLHVGERWVALGPLEAKLARRLAARPGEVVGRHELEEAAWAGSAVRPNTTDRLVHRLRRHIEPVGLVLRTVRGRGYVLESART